MRDIIPVCCGVVEYRTPMGIDFSMRRKRMDVLQFTERHVAAEFRFHGGYRHSNLHEHVRAGCISRISIEDLRGQGSGTDEFNPLIRAHLPKSAGHVAHVGGTNTKRPTAVELGRVGFRRLVQSILCENSMGRDNLVRIGPLPKWFEEAGHPGPLL